MAGKQYSDEELERYFGDAHARRQPSGNDSAKDRVTAVFRAIGIAVGVIVLAVVLFLGGLSFTLPSTELIENPEHLESTIVYTADGVEMARYYLGQNRTWVSGDQISPSMREALVAVEDRRFYEHWGVDMRAFAAVAAGAFSGDGLRGGSTLSMQLARNLYEQIGFERTPIRKLREILTAIQIERRYTKDEILEMYLNTVPWGNNAFGIEAAAQTYFNKPAADLHTEEASVLVGMLKGTTQYSPVRNPERSRTRRNVVLQAMHREGFISDERLAELRDAPIELDFAPYSHTDNLAPHLAEILREDLRDWGRENGFNIYTDGLIVHTSVDSRVQELAQAAVEHHGATMQSIVDVEWSSRSHFFSREEEAYLNYVRTREFEPFAHFWNSQTRLVNSFIRDTDRFRALQRGGVSAEDAIEQLRNDEHFVDSLKTAKTRIETGLVAIEPATGYVKAWVGGRDYVEDQFDHVQTARRQSGSTFKPFVFTAAVDNGYSPHYPLMDSTFVWQQPGQPPWIPRNAGGMGSGNYVTAQQALARSINIPTARLTYEVGPAEVKRYAERMGIESPLEAVPSIGLGVGDVTLLELVASYATLANEGVYNRPRIITRIEDRQGNLLAEFPQQGREALSASTAYTVVNMLRSAIDSGTGGRIRWGYGITEHDVAGKTGTTQESADGWFVLMHPDLVVGAWVGFNDRRVQFRSSYWGQGGNNALRVVGDFGRRITTVDNPAVRLNPGRRFEAPPGYIPPPHIAIPDSSPRPARDLLERWGLLDDDADDDQQEPERRDADRRGRVGW